MAWGNIDERREKVKQLLDSGVSHYEIKQQCSEHFGCSKSAIIADIQLFTIPDNGFYRLSPVIRKRIRERDNYTCQYCGEHKPYSGIIEHVIPFAIGGTNKDYNLVFACQACNAQKRRSVWVPDNLDSITADFPEWREKVRFMARNQ